MKKIFAIAVVALAMIANTANAQIKFGVKGGLNLSELTMSNALGDTFNPENQTGFFVGPTMKVTLPIIGLSLDGAALFNQTSSKADDVDLKNQSIAIPVNVRYGIGLSSIANVFAFAGPQFAFNIGDKDVKFKDVTDGKYSFSSSALSINLGIGATLASHLQVTANYNIPCGKAGEFKYSDALGTVFGAEAKEKTWQVGLTYWF